MSAVGFVSDPEDSEVKKLREACKSLNSVLRNIKDAQTCLDHQNLGLAKAHLKVALDFARKAKEGVTDLGKDKKTKGPTRS